MYPVDDVSATFFCGFDHMRTLHHTWGSQNRHAEIYFRNKSVYSFRKKNSSSNIVVRVFGLMVTELTPFFLDYIPKLLIVSLVANKSFFKFCPVPHQFRYIFSFAYFFYVLSLRDYRKSLERTFQLAYLIVLCSEFVLMFGREFLADKMKKPGFRFKI